MKVIESLHERFVRQRRVEVLSRHFSELLMPEASVLDVGCGDGQIAAAVLRLRPDVTIQGVDVMVRPETAIEVQPFDGQSLPFEDGAFDVVSYCDVLHHVINPMPLLAESVRVSRSGLLVKDHVRCGLHAGWRLKYMDDVGNNRHGVDVPANYWTQAEWDTVWEGLGLKTQEQRNALGIYPWPISMIFDARLHFAGRFVPKR